MKAGIVITAPERRAAWWELARMIQDGYRSATGYQVSEPIAQGIANELLDQYYQPEPAPASVAS